MIFTCNVILSGVRVVHLHDSGVVKGHLATSTATAACVRGCSRRRVCLCGRVRLWRALVLTAARVLIVLLLLVWLLVRALVARLRVRLCVRVWLLVWWGWLLLLLVGVRCLSSLCSCALRRITLGTSWLRRCRRRGGGDALLVFHRLRSVRGARGCGPAGVHGSAAGSAGDAPAAAFAAAGKLALATASAATHWRRDAARRRVRVTSWRLLLLSLLLLSWRRCAGGCSRGRGAIFGLPRALGMLGPWLLLRMLRLLLLRLLIGNRRAARGGRGSPRWTIHWFSRTTLLRLLLLLRVCLCVRLRVLGLSWVCVIGTTTPTSAPTTRAAPTTTAARLWRSISITP